MFHNNNNATFIAESSSPTSFAGTGEGVDSIFTATMHTLVGVTFIDICKAKMRHIITTPSNHRPEGACEATIRIRIHMQYVLFVIV